MFLSQSPCSSPSPPPSSLPSSSLIFSSSSFLFSYFFFVFNLQCAKVKAGGRQSRKDHKKSCSVQFQRTRNSFNFSSRWHRSARKGPYALRPVSQQSSQGCLKTVPLFVWLNTDRSRHWRVECRPLHFSAPLSFRRSML